MIEGRDAAPDTLWIRTWPSDDRRRYPQRRHRAKSLIYLAFRAILNSESECFGIKLVHAPWLPVIWRQRVSRSLLISGEPNDAVLGFIFGADRGNQHRVSRGPRLCNVQDAAADEDRLASVCAHRRWKYHCLSVHRMWSDPRSQSTTGRERGAAIGPRANSPCAIADVAQPAVCRATPRSAATYALRSFRCS